MSSLRASCVRFAAGLRKGRGFGILAVLSVM